MKRIKLRTFTYLRMTYGDNLFAAIRVRQKDEGGVGARTAVARMARMERKYDGR